MKGERELPASRETVWALLNDPGLLKACVPGCESLVPRGEHAFDVVMIAAIGPVKARFKGELSMSDIDPPQGYKLQFDAQSAQCGFARGEAAIRLEIVDAGNTRLLYTATAQIGGKLAQVGSRLVDAAAGATADRFFEAFAAQTAARNTAAGGAGAAPVPTQAAQPGFWSWLQSFLRHLFTRH